MSDLRFAVFGCGFWSRYQLSAWRELEGAACVALCDRNIDKAQTLGRQFGIDAVYDNPEKLLNEQRLDFLDIITDVDSHPAMVELAAANQLPAICQKPMAPNLPSARSMVSACRKAGVPLFIHENWRWQHPIRQFKAALACGTIGRVFRARITYSNSFPVFVNQPFLKQLDQFILTDIGSHILDVARFLFGEPASLYCRTSRVHEDIRGEDVATVALGLRDGGTVTCEMSYASKVEHDRFPETYVFAEGDHGSVELGPDFWIRTTTSSGTVARRSPPPRYAWADPAYDVVHSSIVSCNANILGALQGRAPAETAGDDNLRTMQLVFGAYESAARNVVVCLQN